MLKVCNYFVVYGQSIIICDLNLDVKENEIVVVVGCNGMGKIMLMKLLIGMIFSWGGSVFLNNIDFSVMKSFQWVCVGFGFVFQGWMIFFVLMVCENIEIGLVVVGEKKVFCDFYELFLVLEEMQYWCGGNLFGGQQQ